MCYGGAARKRRSSEDGLQVWWARRIAMENTPSVPYKIEILAHFAEFFVSPVKQFLG